MTPDPQSRFTLGEDGISVKIDGEPRREINPYDEHALEGALKIKDQIPSAEIDLCSVGPDYAQQGLRRGLGMGADHGLHLISRSPLLDHAWFVARAISDHVELSHYDLIFAGAISQDLMQGQVGPMLAGILDIPIITSVIGVDYNQNERQFTVIKEMEQGARLKVTMAAPAVITFQTGPSQPRYPSLSNTLRAKKQELEIIDLKGWAPGHPGSQTVAVHETTPSRDGITLNGSLTEKARQLKDILAQRGLL
jgi:electron transfer flavoprotein beta subunit